MNAAIAHAERRSGTAAELGTTATVRTIIPAPSPAAAQQIAQAYAQELADLPPLAKSA